MMILAKVVVVDQVLADWCLTRYYELWTLNIIIVVSRSHTHGFPKSAASWPHRLCNCVWFLKLPPPQILLYL